MGHEEYLEHWVSLFGFFDRSNGDDERVVGSWGSTEHSIRMLIAGPPLVNWYHRQLGI
jgi:hypothetical protein